MTQYENLTAPEKVLFNSMDLIMVKGTDYNTRRVIILKALLEKYEGLK